MNKCIIIAGPTASGKSSAALLLAKKMNGVIISADSMQIYRSLDIGSAKPTAEERASVEHRMIDILDMCESFSVADFKKRCESEIRSVISEGKLPVICGGTGLYIDALVNNTEFGNFEVEPNIRAELQAEYESLGGEALLSRLEEIDPEAASKLHPKDAKRIVRALEVYRATGKTISDYKRESHIQKSEFDYLFTVLYYSKREMLYERINQRVDDMLSCGLLDETKALLDAGLFEASTASQAIGYKELLGYLHGDMSLLDATELLKRRTRNYAKRQMTWFSRYPEAIKLDCCSEPDIQARLIALTENFINNETEVL